MEIWKTLRVSHISTPPTATTNYCLKRRYTNIPHGTKNRSGQYHRCHWIRIASMNPSSDVLIRFRSVAWFLLALLVIGLTVACSSAKPPSAETSVSSSSQPATAVPPHYEIAPGEKILGRVDILTVT